MAKLHLLFLYLLLFPLLLIDSQRVLQKGQFVGWSRIGAGAYSTVYRARDTLNKNALVSIKDVNSEKGTRVGYWP